MSLPTASFLVRYLHRLWLCAVLLCCLGLVAARQVLTPDPSEENTAPSATGQDAQVAAPRSPGASPLTMPSPLEADARYLVTAFSMQGMRHITDAASFSLLPPGSVLAAQVIRRGETPEVITSGLSLQATPETGARLAPLGANATLPSRAPLLPGAEDCAFSSAPLPLLPYTSAKGFNPYPLVTVDVYAADPSSHTSSPLASTKATLPVSTEMGCRNCHTGPWKENGAGIGEATAGDILRMHDKRNRTRLAEEAAGGRDVDCRSCHGAGYEGGHKGRADLLNLSAAVHGFHAAMDLRGPEGCSACHASAEAGQTRFFRDVHAQWGLECARCHGTMEQHALSLLLAEKTAGKEAARRRLRLLAPALVEQNAAEPFGKEATPGSGNATLRADSGEDQLIVARKPWVNMPHCSGCHNFTEKPAPDTADAYGKWTAKAAERFPNGLDNTGKVRCSSCHGPVHALYPAQNPLGDDRDVIQPLQYQKLAAPLGAQGNCAACHRQSMEYFVHHERVE